MFRVVGGMNKRLQKIECKFNTISLLFSTQHVTRRDECQINSWLLLLPGNRFKGCCFFILYFLAKDKNYRQLECYFTLHGELGNWIGATYRKWKKKLFGRKIIPILWIWTSLYKICREQFTLLATYDSCSCFFFLFTKQRYFILFSNFFHFSYIFG